MGQACWNRSEVTNASLYGSEPDVSWIHDQHKFDGENLQYSDVLISYMIPELDMLLSFQLVL